MTDADQSVSELDDDEEEVPCMPGNDHDYRVIEDWAGDPGVINGTYSWTEVRCRHCRHVLEDADPTDYFDDIPF